MKKLLTSLLFLGLASAAFAEGDFKVPTSVNNIPNASLESAGVDVVYQSTDVVGHLATDKDGNVLTSGLLYWIVRPSTTANPSNRLEIRDSSNSVTTGVKLLPFTFMVISTASNAANSQVMTFNPPLPFYLGLSVNQSGTAFDGYEYSLGIRKKK